MTKTQVIKKNKSRVPFSSEKIVTAIRKSAERCNKEINDEDAESICWSVYELVRNDSGVVSVDTIHNAVETALGNYDSDICRSYRDYRNYRKEVAATWDFIKAKADATMYQGDTENANFLSSLVSTKGSLIRGYLTKELYKKHNLRSDELKAIEDGFIYIHDLRDLMFNSINCCLFDIGNVLSGGFEMANIKYTEPKSILSALQVIGDVTLSATAQQFGGFTLAELDKVLVPYAIKSYNRYCEEGQNWSIDDYQEYAISKTIDEIKQGFQSLEMKLNTVPCSRGDFAFTTLTFGNFDEDVTTSFWQRHIIEQLLQVRMKGQGDGVPVVFPKLVYLYEESQYEYSKESLAVEIARNKSVFDLAIKCSSKCMYPDWLSLNNGYVGDTYKRTEKVISPMGCRAYLSDFHKSDGESVFLGRANVGAVSLNLPMIWAKSAGEHFEDDLDEYLEMIRNFLRKRYELIASMPCSSNPLAYTQGGLYGGTKKPDELIGFDIVRAFTASFGITALNELNVLARGIPLHEDDGEFVNRVIDHINNKIEEFRKEDGYLYATYATPAESLCGTQVKQFRDMFGTVEGVSDKEYFTNGFHCHVTAEISPFEKQDLEEKLFHKHNGGHIQYVRIENPKNLEAIKAFVLRGMSKGFYQGINVELVRCESCGSNLDGKFVEHCNVCGSHDLTIVSRVCGYIGYSKVKGATRFNDSKLAETRERISM